MQKYTFIEENKMNNLSVNNYKTALTNSQQLPFTALKNRNFRLVFNEKKEPVRFFGSSSVVFKITDDTKFYALKCYTTELFNRWEYLKNVQNMLQSIQEDWIAPFEVYENELLVENDAQEKQLSSIVLLPWIEGSRLSELVKLYCSRQRLNGNLKNLYQSFLILANKHLRQLFSHGDITPDNIIVTSSGKMMLIDQDSFTFEGWNSSAGQAGWSFPYQHPHRNPRKPDLDADHFSFLLLATSLKALELNPGLYQQFNSSRGLLFTIDDYKYPEHSKLIKEIEKLEDQQLHNLLKLLLAQLNKKSIAIPDLLKYLDKTIPEHTILTIDLDSTGVINNQEKQNLNSPLPSDQNTTSPTNELQFINDNSSNKNELQLEKINQKEFQNAELESENLLKEARRQKLLHIIEQQNEELRKAELEKEFLQKEVTRQEELHFLEKQKEEQQKKEMEKEELLKEARRQEEIRIIVQKKLEEKKAELERQELINAARRKEELQKIEQKKAEQKKVEMEKEWLMNEARRKEELQKLELQKAEQQKAELEREELMKETRRQEEQRKYELQKAEQQKAELEREELMKEARRQEEQRKLELQKAEQQKAELEREERMKEARCQEEQRIVELQKAEQQKSELEREELMKEARCQEEQRKLELQKAEQQKAELVKEELMKEARRQEEQRILELQKAEQQKAELEKEELMKEARRQEEQRILELQKAEQQKAELEREELMKEARRQEEQRILELQKAEQQKAELGIKEPQEDEIQEIELNGDKTNSIYQRRRRKIRAGVLATLATVIIVIMGIKVFFPSIEIVKPVDYKELVTKPQNTSQELTTVTNEADLNNNAKINLTGIEGDSNKINSIEYTENKINADSVLISEKSANQNSTEKTKRQFVTEQIAKQPSSQPVTEIINTDKEVASVTTSLPIQKNKSKNYGAKKNKYITPLRNKLSFRKTGF